MNQIGWAGFKNDNKIEKTGKTLTSYQNSNNIERTVHMLTDKDYKDVKTKLTAIKQTDKRMKIVLFEFIALA